MRSTKPRPESKRAIAKRADRDSAAPDAPAAATDVALIHGFTPDGGLRVIRSRGGRIEAGAVHPIREGVPIHGEVVSLKPRADYPALCDVEVKYAPPRVHTDPELANSPSSHAAPPQLPAPARRKGPAQVATDTYRDNWDSIWSQPKKKSQALN